MAKRSEAPTVQRWLGVAKRALEGGELMHRVRRVELFGRGEVREDSADYDLRHAKQIFKGIDQLVRLEA